MLYLLNIIFGGKKSVKLENDVNIVRSNASTSDLCKKNRHLALSNCSDALPRGGLM